ncbi:DHA2 family methylenomycin A resistance protein-like MFS transporter [Trinickia symbiotica]|uniref:MFS transporter n=1 Tax=Trinickia symbiotica TaxID=863227 RepID=A0A2N7X9B4_9BURK|nr:MFS transporter [Trinickia symbiotica]PMS38207.1 MFS transporter [Trinickia symbiotica]PPK47099.1 DHA2 family methylenomycin A resistance protein-like MFS transporter [Trinickia symbiotica]
MDRQSASARSPRLALLAASLGFVIICLDVTVVNVALERIGKTLSVGSTGLEWVVNAYTLAFASLLLSAGALGDRLGARRVFVGGLALFTLASIACGLAPSASVLIATRVVQGIAAALCVPSSLSLLNTCFPDPTARAKAVSVWAGTAALALGAGPVVGGVLVDRFGWPSIFLINVPFGVVGIWLTLAHAPDSARNAARHIDLPGQALGVISLAALTFGVVESGRLGWESPSVMTGLAGFVVFSALFVMVERQQPHPMLPLLLFRIPAVNVTSVVGLLLNFGYYGLMFAMSLFFQTVQSYTPLEAGLAFLPMTAVVTVANLVSGALAARFGYRLPMVVGQALAATGFFLSFTMIGAGSSYLTITVPLLAIGVGVALAVPSINVALLTHIDPPYVGIASGVLNTARQIGGAIGVGVFGSLFVGTVSDKVSGLHTAAMIAGGGMVAGALIAIVVLKRAGASIDLRPSTLR